VKAAKVLPKAVELPLDLVAIELTPLSLKTISETVIPAKIAVADVKPNDAAMYNGPTILRAVGMGMTDNVR